MGDRDCNKCVWHTDGNCKKWDCEYKTVKDIRAEGRLNTLKEIQNKMISLHTDMIFEYGADIIEASADAFGELKDWLKEQIEFIGGCKE